MRIIERNIEILIIALIGLFILGVVYFQSLLKSGEFKSPEISYEMARPKSAFTGEFDLQGREIERNLKDPFAKKDKLAPQNVAAQKPVAPVAAQKPAAAAKKAEDKKDDKKSGVQVTVVDEAKKAMDDSFPAASSPYQSQKLSGGRAITGGDKKEEAVDNKKKENLMTEQQWRELVLSQPTTDNVTKLVQAYLKKEIDEEAYFKIVTELIENPEENTQVLGVYAISVVPNVNGFKYIAENYSKLNVKSQKYADNYLNSFAQPSKTGILEQALQSSNPILIEAASKVIVNSYKKVKSDSTLLGISSRDIGVSTAKYDTTYFDKFLQIIEDLKTSSNPSIVSIANSALVTIAGI